MDSKTTEATIAVITQHRNHPDALRLITEKLGVKKMGPADHIRTKHEVKAYLVTGDIAEATAIAQRASVRISEQETRTAAAKITERPGRIIQQ